MWPDFAIFGASLGSNGLELKIRDVPLRVPESPRTPFESLTADAPLQLLPLAEAASTQMTEAQVNVPGSFCQAAAT